jgi:hypothetical protein
MSRDKSRLSDDWDDDEYEYSPPPRRRRPQPQYRQAPRRQQKRRVWPWLLAGCAGGILVLVLAAVVVIFVALRTATNGGSVPTIPGITSQSNYTRQSQQTLQIASLTQLQIHNQIGNVTITADPNATATTITTVKKVKATSSDNANQEFNNISVQVQSPTTTTTTSPLTINATVPDSGSIFGSHNDSVDINVTLPASAVISATPAPTTTTSTQATTFTLNVNNSIGNIMVSGIKGILLLKDDIGNISVEHSTLFDTSHLLTGTGNMTFNGDLDTTPLTSDATPRYKLQSETGKVDVTLPGETNVTLDANTNFGKITSDFPINVTPSDKGANFYGPLNSNTTSGSPTAVLTLNVSTGDVTIHRA